MLFAIDVAAFARWSPQAFTAMLGGLASTGLAILLSGWN